ncbi:hypothetical protein LP421_18885 [Rhizobium sp. RCAM05350]|nr:hypothetical protein LP421_18885 [Rhizobium sp. RCAM05350]
MQTARSSHDHPLQASAGFVTTTLMQSMIDQAEERRVEDEKKARKETKEDDILKAHLSASKSHAALNDKVNAHFFGALKSDDNPMAELISRFLNVLGVTRDEGESDADFATRVRGYADAGLDDRQEGSQLVCPRASSRGYTGPVPGFRR